MGDVAFRLIQMGRPVGMDDRYAAAPSTRVAYADTRSHSASRSTVPTRRPRLDHLPQVANPVLVKVNRIGALTETLANVATAHRAGYTAVMCHRSGETADTTFPSSPSRPTAGRSKPALSLRPHREVQPDGVLQGRVGTQARYAGAEALGLRR